MPIYYVKNSLLHLPRSAKRGIVMFLDVIICAFSVWIAFGLRLDEWGLFQEGAWVVFSVSVGFSFPLFISFGLYRAIFRYVGSAAFLAATRVFVIYGGAVFCVFTLFGVSGVPRSIGVIQPILFYLGVGISRYAVRYWLGDIRDSRKATLRSRPTALIYGAGSAGRQLAMGLSNNKEMQVKGFIDDDPHLHGSTINGIFVYPNMGIHDLIYQLGVTDVLLAIPSVGQNRRSQIISSLQGCGVRVRTLPGLMDLASGRVRISDLHDLDMNDLLGRAVVPPDIELLEKNIRGHVILVTGAGGSIGSELCRQIIKFSPSSLILVDISEHSLYLIYEELNRNLMGVGDENFTSEDDDQASSALHKTQAPIKLTPCLASVRDRSLLLKIFAECKPVTVFHAAAYKHVPLVEQNPVEGIINNAFGTLTCAQVCLECNVKNFILISTDKAVRPTNIMGASKRLAELILQAMADISSNKVSNTKFSMVRFGNVLGSSGSVAPLFSAQINAGGPITLTHREVTRYFMTIPEAAQLVLQASSMAEGGDVFVLDMGEPIRIYDLATKMIYLSGLLLKDDLNPHGDIEILVTGLRPGEKLYEELLIGDNPKPTAHPKIMKAHEEFLAWDMLLVELEELKRALDKHDLLLTSKILKRLVAGYSPNEKVVQVKYQ